MLHGIESIYIYIIHILFGIEKLKYILKIIYLKLWQKT